MWTHTRARLVSAKVLGRRGEHADAEQLAREAVAVAEATDDLVGQGDAHSTLSEVLELGGKLDEAAAALEVALERYERKENLVSAAGTKARLQQLSAT